MTYTEVVGLDREVSCSNAKGIRGIVWLCRTVHSDCFVLFHLVARMGCDYVSVSYWTICHPVGKYALDGVLYVLNTNYATC